MDSRIHTPENAALGVMRREWMWCCGAVIAAVLLSLWVTPLWVPAVDIALAICVMFLNPGRNFKHNRPCGRLSRIIFISLLVSGVISVSIDIAYHNKLIHLIFDVSTINESIPYITSLIIFPVIAVISLLASAGFVSRRHSRECHLQSEYNPSHPMFGRVVHGVYRSMIRCMAILTSVVSVIDWTYYFICYRNESLNSPDRFFFFVVPTAVFLWSLVYIYRSYTSIIIANGYKFAAGLSSNALTDSAVLRYLIIQDGRLLLDLSPAAITQCSVDTPVTAVKALSYHGDEKSASDEFVHLTGIKDFTIRRLYTSNNPVHNNRIYHFLVTIPPEVNTSNLAGEWNTLDNIDRLLKMGVVAPKLGAEIFRIYTITMAWKTYDRKGRRLYPIRNYHPTFRLADFHKWTVDYDDLHWLRVAHINQDGPFYFIRRLFL